MSRRGTQWVVIGVAGLLVLTGWTFPAEGYAAVLVVTHDGVEVQRAHTQAWLPLAAGSSGPLGSGDRLRTDGEGRALLTYWAGAQTLILPDSTFALDALEVNAGEGVRLAATLSGVAIHAIPAAPGLEFRFEMEGLTLTQAEGLFATWVDAGQPFGVTVAEGQVSLASEQGPVELAAGQGFYSGAEVIDFDPPWNLARMQGIREGCAGLVDTDTDVPLRVRIGPGMGYVMMGVFGESQAVPIMGLNESGGWYRIQFLSGYGWMLRLAIQTECQNLPVLPDAAETSRYILGASPDELTLLQPFFGTPRDDPWFYHPETPG